MTSRHRKHQTCVDRVVATLQSLGMQIERHSFHDGYDLLVNDRIKVAIRVAYPHSMHRVTRFHGKEYEYDYPVYVFNFHIHGQLNAVADCFVCIGMIGSSIQKAFVIPRTHLSGKTFYLQAMGQRPYRGKYLPFENNWQILTKNFS